MMVLMVPVMTRTTFDDARDGGRDDDYDDDDDEDDDDDDELYFDEGEEVNADHSPLDE